MTFATIKFQLTRSRGAWLSSVNAMTTISSFQLTRSRGAWHVFCYQGKDFCNFNSHAHVERDYIGVPTANIYWISTHTLTWSVTVWSPQQGLTARISTHTLTWSVTFELFGFFFESIISTHTLTWSVTPAFIMLWIKSKFQLTRSRGAWLNDYIDALHNRHFNSHAHVERDMQICLTDISYYYFNSHAHVERDRRRIWVRSEL